MKCGWLLTSDEYRLNCYNIIVSSYRLYGISMEFTGTYWIVYDDKEYQILLVVTLMAIRLINYHNYYIVNVNVNYQYYTFGFRFSVFGFRFSVSE